MDVIDGGKPIDDDEDDNVIHIGEIVNPWEFEPIFEFDILMRIKDLARCAPKRAVKVAIFGVRDFTDEEQEEFDKYYAEGSAEGEVAIGVQLFGKAIGGDPRAIDQYLTLKAGWNSDGGLDGEDDEVGLNIYLSDGRKLQED